MSDGTPLNPGLGGDTVRDIDRTGQPGALPQKTQVVQLDAGGEYGEYLISQQQGLPVADPATQGAQTSDAPLFVVLTGDPNGDFAGVNWMEQLLDPNNGVSLTTFIKNLPKQDALGAQMQSDCSPLSFNLTNGQSVIIDTLGYQSIDLTIAGSGNGANIYSCNDLYSWQGLNGTTAGASSPTTAIAGAANYKFPVFGRFVKVTVTLGTVPLIVNLRASPHPLGGMAALPVNMNFIAGTTPASTGLSGALAVGGPNNVGAAASIYPVPFGGVDTGGLTRRVQTDTNGNAQHVGALPIGYQWGQYNAKYYSNNVLQTSQTAAQSTVAPLTFGGLDQGLVSRAALVDQGGALMMRPAPTNSAERSLSELLTELIGLTRVLAIYARENLAITSGVGTNVDEPDSLLADVQQTTFLNMPN